MLCEYIINGKVQNGVLGINHTSSSVKSSNTSSSHKVLKKVSLQFLSDAALSRTAKFLCFFLQVLASPIVSAILIHMMWQKYSKVSAKAFSHNMKISTKLLSVKMFCDLKSVEGWNMYIVMLCMRTMVIHISLFYK